MRQKSGSNCDKVYVSCMCFPICLARCKNCQRARLRGAVKCTRLGVQVFWSWRKSQTREGVRRSDTSCKISNLPHCASHCDKFGADSAGLVLCCLNLGLYIICPVCEGEGLYNPKHKLDAGASNRSFQPAEGMC